MAERLPWNVNATPPASRKGGGLVDAPGTGLVGVTTLSRGGPDLVRWSWTARRGDLFGGVAAGVVALPLALAFGVASGLGASGGTLRSHRYRHRRGRARRHAGADQRPDGTDDPGRRRDGGGAYPSFRRGGSSLAGGGLSPRGSAAGRVGLVPDRRLHPLRSLPGHLRVHERHRGDHHRPAGVPARWVWRHRLRTRLSIVRQLHLLGGSQVERDRPLRGDGGDRLSTAPDHQGRSSLAGGTGDADGCWRRG